MYMHGYVYVHCTCKYIDIFVVPALLVMNPGDAIGQSSNFFLF